MGVSWEYSIECGRALMRTALLYLCLCPLSYPERERYISRYLKKILLIKVSFHQHSPCIYKYMKYVGYVTVSMKSNEGMEASPRRYRHPGIELPASWQTHDGEKPASRRDLLPSRLQRLCRFCQIGFCNPFQLIYEWYSANLANVCCI